MVRMMIRDCGRGVIDVSYVVYGVVERTAEGTKGNGRDICCSGSNFRVYIEEVGESDTADARGDARALASTIDRSGGCIGPVRGGFIEGST